MPRGGFPFTRKASTMNRYNRRQCFVLYHVGAYTVMEIAESALIVERSSTSSREAGGIVMWVARSVFVCNDCPFSLICLDFPQLCPLYCLFENKGCCPWESIL